jgi:glycosyltransferase involved in cell wall biosynthesis
VIIPIYNCQKTIELTIKSIHFQNFNEIEIILINDHSLDNSSHIIEELKSFDQRINTINNFKNMGTFYSRCIGALNAKGEYIIGLDNDDLFLSEDIFETLYLNAKINLFDIVEIKSFNIPNYNPRLEEIRSGYYLSHKDNLILHQPELGTSSVSLTNKVYSKDHFAWGKLIRSIIYKKTINRIGKERYSLYNCWSEDVTLVFVLFNTANSFIFLNIFGIFHIVANTTASNKLSNKHKIITHIFYLGILFDFSRNEFLIKNFVARYAMRFSFHQINKLGENDKHFFKSIIKKIIYCKFISEKYKQEIIKKFSPLYN